MMLMFLEVFMFIVLGLAMFSQQPLSIGFFLLVFCFLVSVSVGVYSSSWFSLSLFIIYIGGMLVLFGYVLVLVPNFVFSVSGIFFFFFFLFFFCFFVGGDVSFYFFDFSFSFFSYLNIVVYISLSVVLFIGLVSVAKICFFQVGSLRPFYLFYV